ncbi:Exodeoxyribonuclease I subunit D [Fibrobacter sp. UWH9]|uniref:exonuclease subunit SbcD n=1 Tax=Fibrobacter sp. UWH9 TaxID=1896213 RepID=UPI00091B4241|nr:exonuclease subunit SbcD [Fibrobacter sp. UWH9]SHH90881.1 Exodeoxyribonuclease I subunit D [Fibrobacter sp. UWH9]
MKFIHTADWHLGNTMHDIDRTEETKQFLAWLKDRIVETGAQALLLAGDVFDVVNPSNSAKAQYYSFLASLIGMGCTNVVVVGGNHDSGTLLDAPAELLSALNVKVVGSINNRTVDDLVIEMKDRSGQVIGICCAVPFMRDQELREFYRNESFDDADILKRFYADVYNRAVDLRGDRQIPIVATGHLYAANLSGRNQEDSYTAGDDGVRDVVGTLGNVTVDVFPEGLDYVALGHIHYDTMVAKNPKVRYSGSPFVMGFDECTHKRKVLLVDTEGSLKVEKLEVPRAIRFEQIEGDLNSIKNSLKALDKELAENPMDTYVDVLLTSGEMVNLNDALAVEEKSSHFVVKRHRISREILRRVGSTYSENVESTKQYEKEDYFKMLIASRLQVDIDSDEAKASYDSFLDMFKEAVDLASNMESKV